MNKIRSEKGFTLIELMVVVGIIIILATVVVIAVRAARDQANNARIRTSVSQIRTLAEIQASTTGTYADVPTGAGTDGGTLVADINARHGNPTPEIVVTQGPDGNNYCVSAPLIGGDNYCMDATGRTGSKECDDTTGICP